MVAAHLFHSEPFDLVDDRIELRLPGVEYAQVQAAIAAVEAGCGEAILGETEQVHDSRMAAAGCYSNDGRTVSICRNGVPHEGDLILTEAQGEDGSGIYRLLPGVALRMFDCSMLLQVRGENVLYVNVAGRRNCVAKPISKQVVSNLS